MFITQICLFSFFYRSTFVGSAWSFGFFIPATTANDLRPRRIFYPRLYPLHWFSYLNSWERDSIFPFECSVLNKGTTGTIFITSLAWCGPWLGIEPGTSRTRFFLSVSKQWQNILKEQEKYNIICLPFKVVILILMENVQLLNVATNKTNTLH